MGATKRSKKKTEKRLGSAEKPLLPKTQLYQATLELLKEAWSLGMSDSKACQYAGIHENTLQNYYKASPALKSLANQLKTSLNYKARKVIDNRIQQNDKQVSMWYLEKTDNDFKPTQQQNPAINLNILQDKSLDDTIKELMDLYQTNSTTTT